MESTFVSIFSWRLFEVASSKLCTMQSSKLCTMSLISFDESIQHNRLVFFSNRPLISLNVLKPLPHLRKCNVRSSALQPQIARYKIVYVEINILLVFHFSYFALNQFIKNPAVMCYLVGEYIILVRLK